MKTLLNLLPEEKKDANQRKLRLRFFLWQLFLIMLLECFYLGIIAGIFFILDFQLKSYQAVGTELDTSSSQQQKLSRYEQEFRDANMQTDVIGRISSEHLYFTGVFLLLDGILPDGIVLDHITTKEYAVFLSGTAAKRDDLLTLDARLKQNDCISAVNMPISNLFSQEHVDFQVDFTVKAECLHDNK